MGLVQFQIAPHSSLHLSISTGPLRCSRCSLQGFYSVALVPSEAVPFVYLASVCWPLQYLISVLTQAGGGGLLFRLLVPSGCWEGLVLFSPLGCSGSWLFCMARALRCPPFQPSGVPQKPGTKSCACFLCLPLQSCSGRQELHWRTLPRCGTPSALRIPSPSPRLCRSGACALCLSRTLPGDVDHPESQEVFD